MSQVLCHRCGRGLIPGQGDFYVVRIEAYADPTPPTIEDADLAGDPRAALHELVETLWQGEQSEQEWMDQVHRQLTLHLCRPCYRRWIENPTG